MKPRTDATTRYTYQQLEPRNLLATLDGTLPVNRQLFYDNSPLDSLTAGPSVEDDMAIAADKQALFGGQLASAENFSSAAQGINGVMVDVPSIPGTIDQSDFQFRVGTSDDVTTWTAAVDPTSISVRVGAGVNGSDRITLIWEDGAIANTWLQVTVVANASTGLALDDVFYFGNQTDKTGDFDLDGDVDDADIDFYSGNLDQPAAGGFASLDLNSDGMVTLADHNLHVTTFVETSNGKQGTPLGDVNLDGRVDVFGDGFQLLSQLGLTVDGYRFADLNADQVVDVFNDGFLFLNNIGQNNDASPDAVAPLPLLQPTLLPVSTPGDVSAFGLQGEYFNDANLTGLAETRVDPFVQLPVGFGDSPDAGSAPAGTSVTPDDQWSIRWTGYVWIELAGDWTFHTDSDGGARLWVNGQSLIDNWTNHALERDSASLDLPRGWVPIELDYYQDGGAAAIELLFESPGGKEQVIPPSRLASQLLTSNDIGNVGASGNFALNHKTGQYTIQGSGADIFGRADAFRYSYTQLTGDGSITARVNSVGNTNNSAKGGVMFRESLAPGSRNVMTELKATTGAEFQYRQNDGGTTSFVSDDSYDPPGWVRLEREGNVFRGFVSTDGVNWQQISSTIVAMSETVFVGLAVTSHNNSAVTTVSFDNVNIDCEHSNDTLVPPDPDVVGTGVTGFIPLLTSDTFNPLANDTKTPSNFFGDGDEFYTFRNANGVNKGYNEDSGKSASDDDVVFRLTPAGELHILGVPDNGQTEPFGYISTEDGYRNYHLTLEYRWGTEKFNPRNGDKRDSGLLYHSPAVDGSVSNWPDAPETQIQEGDTGDFFFLWSGDKSRGKVTKAPGTNVYQPGGVGNNAADFGVRKSQTVDSLTEWNRVEVIIEQDQVTVVVNGVVVNRATDLTIDQSGGLRVPLTEGKIQLQAEGAEVFYRNLAIKPTASVGGREPYKVLLFQETESFDHRGPGSIQAAEAAIAALGASNGFSVDVANTSNGVFNDANLAQYAAVIWNSTTGDVLSPTSQAAFERYVQAGGGFVGLHSAADTEYDWQWYGDLVGAYFQNHPSQQLATLRVDAEATIGAGGSGLSHPAVDSLPQEWQRVDEWYNYQTNPRSDVNVLLTLDESTYNESDGSSSADDHPISWWHDYDGGRSFYTGMGHRPETYTEPLFLTHLLGGIEYAAGVSRVAPDDATVLYDGTDLNAFEKTNGSAAGWRIDSDDNLAIVAGTGDIQTKDSFTDYRLHLEFKTPATLPSTAEQQRGNSGVYLHNSYELQILDSYADSNFDAQHLGSLYNFKTADANAALPAETWQVYEVDFTAPRFSDSVKTANARVTVHLNGILIHDDVELTGPTAGGQSESPGARPFRLQNHDANSLVEFRNIWVQPVTAGSAAPATSQVADGSAEPVTSGFASTLPVLVVPVQNEAAEDALAYASPWASSEYVVPLTLSGSATLSADSLLASDLLHGLGPQPTAAGDLESSDDFSSLDSAFATDLV